MWQLSGIWSDISGVVNSQSSLSSRKESNRRQPPRTTPRPTPKPTPAPEEDDAGLTDDCPEPNGFFADAYQCDKYYECKDGAITEKLCPDGMVFNDFSPLHEKCDLPFGIDCSQRPELRKCAGEERPSSSWKTLTQEFNWQKSRSLLFIVADSMGTSPTRRKTSATSSTTAWTASSIWSLALQVWSTTKSPVSAAGRMRPRRRGVHLKVGQTKANRLKHKHNSTAFPFQMYSSSTAQK